MKLADGQQHYVQTFDTEFHANREINVENMDRNAFASLNA